MSSKSPKHDPAGSSANNKPATQQLSKDELDRVTEVFKMYETGLREATIYPKVRPYCECNHIHSQNTPSK